MTPTESPTFENEGDPPAFLDSLSARIDQIKGMKAEEDTYPHVCYVLNFISRRLAPASDAILFASHPNTRPLGDYLDYMVKPDVVAYHTSTDVLDKALEKPPEKSTFLCSVSCV